MASELKSSELKLVKELSSIYICKAIEHMPLAEFKVLRIISAYANSDLAYKLVDKQHSIVNAYCIRYCNDHAYIFTYQYLHVYLDNSIIASIDIPEYVSDSGPFEITHVNNILHCRIPHYHNIKYITIDTISNIIISIFDIKPYILDNYVTPRKYFNRFNNYVALSFSHCDEYMSQYRIHNEDTDSKYVAPESKSIKWIISDSDSDDSDDSDELLNYTQLEYHPRQVWQPQRAHLNDQSARNFECFKSIYYTLTHNVFSIYAYKNILATMSTDGNCYLYDTHILNDKITNNYIFSFPVMQLNTIRFINAMYIIDRIIYIISNEYIYICDVANYKHAVVQTPNVIHDICIVPNGILAMTKHHIYIFNKI